MCIVKRPIDVALEDVVSRVERAVASSLRTGAPASLTLDEALAEISRLRAQNGRLRQIVAELMGGSQVGGS